MVRESKNCLITVVISAVKESHVIVTYQILLFSGTATLEVCLDGLFNQIVATYDQPNIQDWFSLIVDFIRKIVERNPLLKNKYLDILPKIILITVNHGNLSAVKYLVDHIIGIGRESECATGFERKILCLISDRCCLGR